MTKLHVGKQQGFTIVELLIVIVVIAILATISIVAYNGIQNRANDAAVQSDLANFGKQAELFKVDNGRYPGSLTELSTLQSRPSKGSYMTSTAGQNNFFYCADNNDATTANATDPTDATKFVISARSKSGTNYYVSSSGKGTLGSGVLSAGSTPDYCQPIGYTAGTNTWATNGYVYSTSSWNATWIF